MKPPAKIFVDYDADHPAETLEVFPTAQAAFESFVDDDEPVEVAVYKYVGLVKIRREKKYIVTPTE